MATFNGNDDTGLVKLSRFDFRILVLVSLTLHRRVPDMNPDQYETWHKVTCKLLHNQDLTVADLKKFEQVYIKICRKTIKLTEDDRFLKTNSKADAEIRDLIWEQAFRKRNPKALEKTVLEFLAHTLDGKREPSNLPLKRTYSRSIVLESSVENTKDQQLVKLKGTTHLGKIKRTKEARTIKRKTSRYRYRLLEEPQTEQSVEPEQAM